MADKMIAGVEHPIDKIVGVEHPIDPWRVKWQYRTAF